MRKLEKTLQKKKSEQAAAERKEKELAEEVDRISRELRSSRRALDEARVRVEETERRRRLTEERLWASRLEMSQWGDLLSREIAAFYRRQLAMRTGAETELAYRRAALREKVEGLAFAKQHHAHVEELRDELVDLEVDLQRHRLGREREERRVEAAEHQMKRLHRTAQGRRAVLEKEIRDLQSSAQELSHLVRKLIREKEARDAAEAAKAAASAAAGARAKKKPAALTLNRKRGRLPWPLEGTVVERYGRSRHPELDTFVFSNGVKLRPAGSATVRAVEKGEVLYAGQFMSYGLMALVQHDDNMHSVYAQLGRIDVARGQKVAVGQGIGQSGQDDQGRPLLYFELRLGGVAVDPLVWLQ